MNMKESSPAMQPVVCCVDNRYVICIPTKNEALISVLINGQRFTSDDNGVRKSHCSVHKIEVPMELLDQATQYTLEYIPMLERRPYRSQLGQARTCPFAFQPIPDRYPIRIAHLSDVHGLKNAAVQTGAYFNSALDLLILNGDISSSSDNLDEALLPLQIAYEITRGERPCVITRGNHDLRGKFAEHLSDIYPTDSGRMYYRIRFQNFRLLVLDCGEDKDDSHVEYGGTAAFHQYRLQETDFLNTLRNDPSFMNADSHLIVVSHIPFPHTDGNGEFAIEQPLYAEWCDILNTYFHPALCLFGHHHRIEYLQPDDSFNSKQIQAPIILGGMPVSGPVKDVCGTFLSLYQTEIEFVFSNRKHQVLKQGTIRII